MSKRFKYKIYLTYLVNEMTKIIEIGKISSRGQIAIPAGVRRELELQEGGKVLFILDGDTLIIKKVNIEKTWEEITRPLKESAKKSKLKETDIENIVHRFRKSKKR